MRFVKRGFRPLTAIAKWSRASVAVRRWAGEVGVGAEAQQSWE